MAGFDNLYREGGAVTWQAGKEDVVQQVSQLLMNLDESSRILDFGCGTGWTAKILTADGARYLGIDPSAEGIAVAQRLHGPESRARFQQLRIDELLTDALRGATFTHIFALDALYFAADIEGTLRTLHGALEADGTLTMISHIYRESRVADSLVDAVTLEHGYPQFLSGVQWNALLDRNGFRDICRYRFYDRRPFNPTRFLGHPTETIRLARQLYEREGALVITARC